MPDTLADTATQLERRERPESISWAAAIGQVGTCHVATMSHCDFDVETCWRQTAANAANGGKIDNVPLSSLMGTFLQMFQHESIEIRRIFFPVYLLIGNYMCVIYIFVISLFVILDLSSCSSALAGDWWCCEVVSILSMCLYGQIMMKSSGIENRIMK